MTIESKATQLIVSLTKETSKGMIKWDIKPVPNGLDHGTDDLFPLYFQANYKGQRIGIAQRRRRTFNIDYERFFWEEAIVLVLIDASGRILWEFSEGSSALWNLFELVRQKATNIDGILDDLLNPHAPD